MRAQPMHERLQGQDLGDAVAPALLAGRHRDLLPVRHALVGPFAREAQHGALGLHRLHGMRAQLHRLLHHPVHLVARRQRLHQHDAQRRLALERARLAELREHRLAAHRQARLDLAAAAVEQHHHLAIAQAQHAQRMVGERLGERDLAARGQAIRKVES